MQKYYFFLILIFLFTACATYNAKYIDPTAANDVSSDKEISHTFYFIGDAGLSPSGQLNPALKQFKKRLDGSNENSTAIFLGDNIYPAGMPSKKDDLGHSVAKNNLDAQLKTVEGYKGKTVFIPGNHDWYSEGLKGLERQQKYIEKQLNSKEVFFPEDGCPMQKIDINDDVVVIAIDTEWYLTNWDRHPTMNDECEIKDREKFFEELEGLIKKNLDKTTILAMHHPVFTYGVHGGHFSFKHQVIPVLGSFVNVLRRTTGASTTDVLNKRYTELRKRIVTLAQYSEKVVFASGHEHSLQYIVEENTPQIVSGSGAKKGATRLLNGSKFSTGKMGYATMEVYKDGSSRVRYYGVMQDGNEEFLFTSEVLPPERKDAVKEYPKTFPAEVKSSIYSTQEIEKSNFFKSIWGERYRDVYAKQVSAPTVDLDTLFGGLKVTRKGGGHQSKSLRLETKEGKEYVMRALRKSAEVYLQAIAFKDKYVLGRFEDSYVEELLLDFYTGAHPYAPFAIGTLSEAAGIYHTNPVMYYVPKQKALTGFDDEFGDELYMIEERTTDGHGDQASFGYANKLESTDDLLKKLRKDEKYSVDKTAYVKARLFDMLIGDWDRHVDQWRWAEFKDDKTGDMLYRPIPRDRDQAFSLMGDGALMKLATKLVPSLGIFEGFNEEIRSVKGFTSSPMTFALDMALLPETNLDVWEEQATFLQTNITPEIIDKALLSFPVEVRDAGAMARIKRVLLARKNTLVETAREYYGIINKFSVVAGTDKDDHFTVTGMPDGKVEVTGYRIKNGKKGDQFFKKIYDRSVTKEVWIYGLDDDDYFEVRGVKNGTPKIRIVGGQNNDIYDVENSKGVYIYDNKAKKNTFKSVKGARKRLTNDYETNTYRPILIKNSSNQIIPTIGANPDDGLRIGISDTYTYNGFEQNPFTSQHTFNASFYFATSGFDLGYTGEFANVVGKANLELSAKFTSPNFSINFFGFGNGSENMDDDLDLDFNRVKLETFRFAPSLVWRGDFGSKVRTGVSYESIEVEETDGRFINTFFQQNGEETENNFFGVDAEYSYANSDSDAFPTLGMATSLHVGYKTSTENSGQSYGFIIPSLAFDYKLVPSGQLVLATKGKAHFNIGDDYEFYQGASIGGFDGLRGFRNQRFTGKTSFYQNTDLRLSLSKLKAGFLPLSTGLFAGFDYGRVWFPGDDDSDQWHTSIGGGFFLNIVDITSVNLALFSSDDGLRFTFGLGFGF
ncbi:metallophosphoesterase [Spongiimicrobium sp. 3-5]|uniref:metallophosphoesterase n=1 Tax=Spongiimicrobium sp. 3-5 TaxID=3332596 RepID=UPI003980FC31